MTPRITIAAAKDKGRRLQQYACEKISNITGFHWGVTNSDSPIESRPMGQSGTDVRMESHVLKAFPYSIECKAQENWGIHEFIKQAKENKLPDTNWLLICKKSRKDPVVVISYKHFKYKLLKRFEIDLQSYRFEKDAWRLDTWIEDARKESGKDWILFLSKKGGKVYCMLDADKFFSFFGVVKMKRTK